MRIIQGELGPEIIVSDAKMQVLREAYRRFPGHEVITFDAKTPPYKVGRYGNRIIDPDYIVPALRPEPIQYEQCLVGYEVC